MPAGLNLLDIYTPTGQFLANLNDWIRIECTMAEMQVGTLVIELPPSHDPSIYQRDARIAYRRSPTTDNLATLPRLVGNTTWLLARRQLMVDRDNQQTVRLTCVHPNALLARRVVAYDEGSAEAKKTDEADDLIKAVVRENFASATDTDRNWSSAFFSVEADVSAAPSIDKEFSYRTVLQVCQEAAAAAAAGGTYIGFEVFAPLENGAFQLRTYTGQRGTDRSSISGQPLTLGVAYGSLDDTELDENWLEMVSFVYASGSGKKSQRVVQTASDADLILASPYGRIEWLQNVTQTIDTAVLTSEAQRTLRERRPRLLFTGAVRDTEYATFMEEYDWGDKVIGEFSALIVLLGYSSGRTIQQFDCRIDPVKITVERAEVLETGEIIETETLDIRLRSEG